MNFRHRGQWPSGSCRKPANALGGASTTTTQDASIRQRAWLRTRIEQSGAACMEPYASRAESSAPPPPPHPPLREKACCVGRSHDGIPAPSPCPLKGKPLSVGHITWFLLSTLALVPPTQKRIRTIPSTCRVIWRPKTGRWGSAETKEKSVQSHQPFFPIYQRLRENYCMLRACGTPRHLCPRVVTPIIRYYL